MVPIAVQLYSVRDEAARDLFGTLEKVAAMGYKGVEFAGYHGHSAADIRAKLHELGLKCEGTHTGIDLLSDDKIEQTIADHKTLGTEWVIIPWLPGEKRNTPAAAKATADELTALTEKLRAEGLRLGFHAHSDDMHALESDDSAYYILGKNTPKDFILQYDTSNGMEGGADPVQPIVDFPNRNASVHLKETGGNVIGQGEVPWERVFEAAENGGGVEWYVVEHESGQGTEALDAVAACLEALKGMGKA
ncbi:sugar phosphate isomerase/epimerase [bacterium]|nr:MAG: sugar phosphate isomerase/epimerase [bacterium]